MKTVIEVKDLVKRYKELIALDHFNLSIKEGEIFGLLGPNGGSLTLCLPLDFHNPLHHSPLRLIFLSNFKILLVIVCHCVL